MRHLDGRRVYLTEAAVEVFEAERHREANERAWGIARGRWLQLAATLQVPLAKRDRIALMPISEAAVEAARILYTTAADAAAREARGEKRWEDVVRIRGEHAAALYADAGSPVPPPDDLVALYREGKSAMLRSLAKWAPDVELVGAGCCRSCREDDGKAFKIAKELREPRLPHPGCPKGLCGCDWWMAVMDQKPARRRRAASPRAAHPDGAGPAEPGAEPEAPNAEPQTPDPELQAPDPELQAPDPETADA